MSGTAPPGTAETPVLEVSNLKTWFHTDDGVVKAVDDVSFAIRPGQTLGVVGESGSGKSVTALTVLRLLPDRNAQIAGGRVAFLGRDVVGLSASEMSEVRGRDVAMIFQEPMTSLNPVMRVGDQVAEAIVRHERVSWRQARARAVELFREVGIPSPELRVRAWPHEMSGGQKQRVMIAMALACNPKLLVADEPTTALDVTIQAQILDLIRSLAASRRMACLFITHDLGVIASIAHEVAVMFRGRLVEYGPVAEVLRQPRHPYTKGLLACRPTLDTPYRRLPTVDDFLEVRTVEGGVEIVEKPIDEARLATLRGAGTGPERRPAGDGPPLLEVSGLRVRFPKQTRLGFVTEWNDAVNDVSFEVQAGRTLGLVGESGCGKTTIGRALLRLQPAVGGRVVYRSRRRAAGEPAEVDLLALSAAGLAPYRQRLQIVFQDPYSSLNPRLTVEEALVEPMGVHGLGGDAAARRARAATLLDEVGLPRRYLRRYPHEFSGGQRQRICIARALAVEPEFLVCDESVSALDVSVQAQVLNLLKDLQEARGLTYLFISHDLSVVKFMSDEMCVMQAGQIVEAGPSDGIYASPKQEYTRKLIASIPA